MKREKLRYTEHRFNTTPTSTEGWIKVVILHVVVGPLRLVNEVTQKFVFLGTKISKRILITSMAINAILLAWNSFLWPLIAGPSRKEFLPTYASLISMVLIGLLYYSSRSMVDFSFTLLDTVDEQEDEEILSFDADSYVAFAEVKSAEIAFEESVNIFIRDPAELEVHNIPAPVYQAAEDDRLVQALSKSGSFISEPIVIPELLTEPPIGSQIRDNFDSMRKGLNKQLTTRDKMLDDALSLELK